jgi:hypothetical protein
MLGVGLAAVLLAGACTSKSDSGAASPSSTTSSCGTESGAGCAPEGQRVELVEPSFSDPTNVTNPLFPVGKLAQVLLLGNVGDSPLRVEYTVLPDTKTIDWNGRQVDALEVQYLAHLDGRISEVALDWFAQDDGGSVWYLGEDVFNYDNGFVANNEGTWLAGRDGPGGMIMPADPEVGDVYRPENIPGLVFEEVTVKSVQETVDGPHGAVDGAITVNELHLEGSHEGKIFAPGYGEFSTSAGSELEAVALAVPTDELPGPPPAELSALSTGAADIFETAGSEDWNAASATLDAMTAAWDTYRAAGDVPPMLDDQMSRALGAPAGDGLTGAVDARNVAEARKAALNVGQASLDLQLQYRPLAEIDLARLDLWARRLLVDAAGDDLGAVVGDVATLEWIWDRVAHVVAAPDAERIETQLDDLRTAADGEDLAAAADAATALRDSLAGLEPAS